MLEEKSSVCVPVVPEESCQLICAVFIPLVSSIFKGRFTVPFPFEQSGFTMIKISSSIGFSAVIEILSDFPLKIVVPSFFISAESVHSPRVSFISNCPSLLM